MGKEVITCKCGSNWFRTCCGHCEGETGTVCAECDTKIYIDWSRYQVIEERSKSSRNT
jgi:predicted metalloprotease